MEHSDVWPTDASLIALVNLVPIQRGTHFSIISSVVLVGCWKNAKKTYPWKFWKRCFCKYISIFICRYLGCLDFFHVNRLNCRRICPQWIQLTMTMNKNSCWPASVLQVLLVSDSLPEHSSYTVVIHSCHLSNQQPRKQHGRFVTSFDVTSSEHT